MLLQAKNIFNRNNQASQLRTLKKMTALQNDVNSDHRNYMNWSKKRLIQKIKELQGIPIVTQAKGTTTDGVLAIKQIVHTSIQKKKKKKNKEFDMSKHSTRHIALRFSYLGWNYQGLAIQNEETKLPTVESEILKALNKTRLVNSFAPHEFKFSRCGRTDKGVSAMNQVISLVVRSKLTKEELEDPVNDCKELDYVRSLNQVLPSDIRFHSVCLRPPPGFDARFSCIFRHYKYVFNGKGLYVEKMREAASFFLGEKDFRNFCKMDASKQITNYKRNIIKAEIEELKSRPGFYFFDLKGSAFLWHQVRCMTAVLLAVGQGLEDPAIVKRLLDIKEFPSKPVYNLAHDIPLVLYDCGFNEDEVKWSCGPDRVLNHHLELSGLQHDYQIKSIMSDLMENTVTNNMPAVFDRVVINLGDGSGKAVRRYVPYEKRSRLETSEEVNEKWRNKNRDFKETL